MTTYHFMIDLTVQGLRGDVRREIDGDVTAPDGMPAGDIRDWLAAENAKDYPGRPVRVNAFQLLPFTGGVS